MHSHIASIVDRLTITLLLLSKSLSSGIKGTIATRLIVRLVRGFPCLIEYIYNIKVNRYPAISSGNAKQLD